MGQDAKYDFLDQLGLIKNLTPDIKTVGVMLGPTDYDLLITSMGAAQSQFGLKVIPIKLNNVKTKQAQYIKMAAIGVAKKYNIKALMFFHIKDKITSSQVGIKFTAGSLRKQGVSVFSSDEKALKLGCLGRFILKDDAWVMQVSKSTAGKLGVTIPSGDSEFLPE